jgi:hypothetical protein
VILHSVDWLFVSDASGQPIHPLFRGLAAQKKCQGQLGALLCREWCVCVCAHACVRARERERERDWFSQNMAVVNRVSGFWGTQKGEGEEGIRLPVECSEVEWLRKH